MRKRPKNLRVTDHAVERLKERAPWLSESHDWVIREKIRAMYDDGVFFGGQFGKDYSLLCRYGNSEHQFVLVCGVQHSGNHAVKTVLTPDQAIANISIRRSARKAYSA